LRTARARIACNASSPRASGKFITVVRAIPDRSSRKRFINSMAASASGEPTNQPPSRRSAKTGSRANARRAWTF
jgi:hypothetical protein